MRQTILGIAIFLSATFSGSPIAGEKTEKAEQPMSSGNVLDELQDSLALAESLANSGEPTLAAEHLVHIITRVMSGGTKNLSSLGPERRRQFFNLFSLWASLPHKKEDRQAARETFTTWFQFWKIEQFLELAPEVLIQTLGAISETPTEDNTGLPAYDHWLDLLLSHGIGDTRTRIAVESMVKGVSSHDPADKENYYRTAVASGYSHPLPYLLLVELLIKNNDLRGAKQVYDMYVFAVKNNAHWRLYRNTEDTEKPGCLFRTAETIRLETLFSASLSRLGVAISAKRSPYLSLKDNQLGHVWEYWPEQMKPVIGELLFNKSLELTGFRYETDSLVVEINERFFPWHDNAALERGLQKIDHFLGEIPSGLRRLHLPQLHELTIQMLDALGRQKDATRYLQHTLDSGSPRNDNYILLYSILVARELKHLGADVSIPRYEYLNSLFFSNNFGPKKLRVEKLDDILNQAKKHTADVNDIAAKYSDLISLMHSSSGKSTYVLRWKHGVLSPMSGYVQYQVSGDGLCMYNALAQISSLPVQSLIDKMSKILDRVATKIYHNMSVNLPWKNGLTQEEWDVVALMIESTSEPNLAILNENQEILHLASQQALSGIQIGADTWGDWTMLSLASVAMSQLGANMSFAVELPEGHPGIPGHYLTFDGTGQYEAAWHPPQMPVLIHNANHWSYVLPEQGSQSFSTGGSQWNLTSSSVSLSDTLMMASLLVQVFVHYNK